MPNGNDLLREARKYLGVNEEKGPNHNRFTDWYADRYGEAYRRTPWCAIFIVYCARKAGISADVIPTSAWTPSILDWFKKRGRVTQGYGPRVGDVVLMDWPGGDVVEHVGIVAEVLPGGLIKTIEGNWRDSVAVVTRRVTSRLYFCHPAYSGGSAANASGGSGKLDVDGIRGPLTIKALQRWLGVAADGLLGPITAKALQGKLNVAQDGKIGPQTTKALQRLVGANPDGIWGRETTRKLQTYLNREVG